jgi:hypothetical protein
MKRLITCFLVLLSITAKSQVQLAQVFHGCSGATITAYPSDATWTSITYQFQRFEGNNWVTVHTNTNNWHLVTPGDITVISTYRVVLRNNVTSEERTSNSVTVNPALFFITVLSPQAVISWYWGTDFNGGVNAAEFLPHNFGADTRPPYTFEYKKVSETTWQSRVAPTGIFVFPMDANTPYQFRVTNVCGQTSLPVTSELLFATIATQTDTTCSGGTIQVRVTGNGQYFEQRGPFRYGYALIPPGTSVTDSLLNTINYTYPGSNITGLAQGQYVVRAIDRFGVKSKYAVVNVNVNPLPPFVLGYGLQGGPFGPFCQYFATLKSNPYEKGIRIAGSGQPYTFSTGLTFNNLLGGTTYEMVLRDSCGRLSTTILETPTPLPPRINNIAVTSATAGCNYIYTINATACTVAEYGLKLRGTNNILWQTSNVFNNIPKREGCDSVFVRDVVNGLISRRQVCTDGLRATINVTWDFYGCSSTYSIIIDPWAFGTTPPYTYAISYDGINYTSQPNNSSFTNLEPGTYSVKVTDACGLELATTTPPVEAGSVYYLKASGVNDSCGNGATLGGYLRFGLNLFKNDSALSPRPFTYQLKEVIGQNGNSIQYGPTVLSGQSQDTVFTIKGLEGNKNYGIFITNGCGQVFTARGRVANSYNIPAFATPLPVVNIDSSNCTAPFITATNLPDYAVVKVFPGRDTTGTPVPMADDSTTAALAGGYYTIKIKTDSVNSCPWEKIFERYVKTNDSTGAGIFDPNVGNGICAALPNTINLYDFIINESPGGAWSASPAINWSNQSAGELKPGEQPEGTYDVTYTDTSYCGVASQVTFPLDLRLNYCQVSEFVRDFESASSSVGCSNYSGDVWKHVLDNNNNLMYSINAGAGNTINNVCWGSRVVSSSGVPRSTVINGRTIYFASRNFYMEPGTVPTIGANPVRIRLYFTPFEINQLVNFLRANGFPAATVNNLVILKKKAGPNSPVDLDVTFNPGSSTSLYSVITPIVAPLGFNGNQYFEFEINSFSEFALAFSNNLALPVTWLSVTGKLQNGQSIIDWATATESNTANFIVEHSIDGRNYTALETLPAAGYSNSRKDYQYIHAAPVYGNNYYRIKQTDLDGRYSYSEVLVLKNNNGRTGVTIAPNPVQNEVILYFSEASNKTIQLHSMNGALLRTEKINGAANRHIINMVGMAPGVYILQVSTKKGVESYKIIKQ